MYVKKLQPLKLYISKRDVRIDICCFYHVYEILQHPALVIYPDYTVFIRNGLSGETV